MYDALDEAIDAWTQADAAPPPSGPLDQARQRLAQVQAARHRSAPASAPRRNRWQEVSDLIGQDDRLAAEEAPPWTASMQAMRSPTARPSSACY